jgi:acetyl esterase/lipase
MYLFFVAGLARATGSEIVVPDYRLAPEFPFPAGLDDANAVFDGLLADGVLPERLLVGGDSGGGGLAGSLLYARRAAGSEQPAGALLFSPEVNLAFDLPSVRANSGRDVLPWNLPSSAYLHGANPSSPAVSAVNQDVAGWPPTFVAYGGDEMFRDGIRLLASNLQEAGIPTVAIEEPGMIHVFPILLPWAPASRRVAGAVRQFVASRLEGGNGC